MWVRTQNKLRLLKVDEFTIKPNNEKKYGGKNNTYSIISNGKILGTYESEERCMEILDDIFSWIGKQSGYVSVIVYNMPQE